ncbi:MAG: EamA family transporter RarD, partial [Rectinema sp.]|nr:EamA family transporter RarD [Rectinema sp.]
MEQNGKAAEPVRVPRFSARAGTWAAVGAYGMWGLLPIYWKLLSHVSSLQILAHRIIWAGLFCFLLLALTHAIPRVGAVLRNRRTVRMVLASAVLVTFNWGMYIYGITSGRVLETALGYYINPLMSVLLGAIIFRERIDKGTLVAVGLAIAGIGGAVAFYGRIPWLSLGLAVTFALYGAVKKGLDLPPVESLFLETAAATPVALAFLAFVHNGGHGAFLNAGLATTALLAFSGVMTAIPLLLFGTAAVSIKLQTIGFIQYFTPTCQLLLG